MKHFKSELKILQFVALVLLGVTSYSQVIISNENFEAGWGIWNDGGVDCQLVNGSALNGTWSPELRDNSGVASSMTTNNINLTPYGSVSISFDYRSQAFWWGLDFWVLYSDDGGTTWTNIGTYANPSMANNTNYSDTITIDTNSYTLSANSQFRIQADAGWDGTLVYIDNVVILGYPPQPEIDVQGNNIDIANGDLTPYLLDNTNFGPTALGTTVTRTFEIENNGTASLNITSIILSNTTDFTLVGVPYTSPVGILGNTFFSVRFNSLTPGTASTLVTITNNDSDEGIYQFQIDAKATLNFFDSDGDGVDDNIDIDDDNDGILDTEEEGACQNSPIAITTNYKFLNETFGTGTNRSQINTTYDAITSYCYEDGSVGIDTASCTFLSIHALNDGEYSVYYQAGNGDGIDQTPIGEIASWADDYWYTGLDHTAGDTNGRMAMFNASYDPGIFYTATITGALPNVPINYSFWVLNLDRSDAPGIATRLRPDILVEFRDVNNNVLASITTGSIAPTTAGNAAGDWYNFSADLALNVTEFYVYFINNEAGGLGNDLAIDDIQISQTLCDLDNDSVADIFDLDSDNDGIPDVVEAGLGILSEGKATLTTSSSWTDANGNGMHDLAEGNIPPDTDGDGTPNWLDLDSDNDSIFDVDESGAGNPGDVNFQNGDGDIDGNGTGDGPDTDSVREIDVNSDGTLEYYSDGILDVYDFLNGGSFNTAYGNNNQGVGHTYYVVDTDADGIPDYMDITSDGVTFDISHTLYASLDTDNDGEIDDTNDAEGDGIVDLFDTDDVAFGSPRDLERKLLLHFDGRNDYVEDVDVLGGSPGATLMAWVKLDPTYSNTGDVAGQGMIRMYIDSATRRLRSYFITSAGSSAYGSSSTSTLDLNRWYHVAISYDGATGAAKIYLNGALERTSTIPTGTLSTNVTFTTPFSIGRNGRYGNSYFNGNIDEVRVIDRALSDEELQKMVYQEIENNALVRGTVIPRDISTVPWTDVERYYRLDNYKGDITDDLTTAAIDTGTGAKLYNIKVIDYQSAPMPFVTQQSGSLPTAVNITADGVNGNDAVTYDWSIVHVEHDDVHYNADQGHLGLFVDALDDGSNPIEFSVQNDSELNVSWYLSLDGMIDLEGESQLVQTDDSQLDVTSSGRIERDQQGTADLYTYNYWSSPVGLVNTTTNNTSFIMPNVFRDGTNPGTPENINFVGGFNGSNTTPISIADYWIYKFVNAPDDDYASWQQVRSTGNITPGEGFTLKGPGTGGIATPQNYVFDGKPNNGDISLNITAGNDYLVGNPYPSAIDAHEFLDDNPLTGGTLYFWEHWGGGSHLLADYQGGYAQYNYSGGTGAASYGTNDPDVGTGGTPTKLPGQYIPVSQGFFVAANVTGTVNFENDQRIFATEGASSTFVRSNNLAIDYNEDDRIKFRIGFNSANQIHRQLLLTVDENATADVDWGYDGTVNEQQIDDMYWMIDDEKYVIQGTNVVTEETVVPLGIHVRDDGMNAITIDHLENVPNDVDIYVYDNVANTYQDLRVEDYQVFLTSGEYLDRFSIVFTIPALSNEEQELLRTLEVHYLNDEENILVINPTAIQIDDIEIFNILGQSIQSIYEISNQLNTKIKVNNLSTGTYIIKLNAEIGTISKKVLVK